MGRNESKLNMAVIGGGFGSYHLNGILSDPDRFELKIFCDANPAVVEQRHQQFPGITSTCTNYRDILDNPAIDAVVVSLPHHLHEKVCIEAAQSGKHIIVDKPIARTLEEADNIIRTAKENEVMLMVAMNFRFDPGYSTIRNLLTSGAIGKPVRALTRHIQNFNNPIGANWRSKKSVGGGCVIGSGIHNIDLMRWFFGEPFEVFAYGASEPQRLEAEAAATIMYRYENGLIVNFDCNWCSHGAMNSYEWGEWDISGTSGDVAFKSCKLLLGRDFGRSMEKVEIDPGKFPSLWAHFHNCVINGTQPLISGEEGRASLALVLKAYESMQTGKPIKC